MAAPEPQAPAAVAYTPVLTDLLRLARAPFAPRGVYEEQREHPTFWVPWAVLSAIWIGIAILMLPLSIQAARVASAAVGRPLPDSALTLILVTSVLGPAVGLLIGALISAVVLYLVVMVSGSAVRFTGLMTVAIFASPVAFLQSAVTAVALRMRGVESIQRATDLRLSFGLDLLFPVDFDQAHPAFAAVLRGIGPFELWALAITAVGLMALEKTPKGKAWTAAALAFLIGLAIRGGMTLLLPVH